MADKYEATGRRPELRARVPAPLYRVVLAAALIEGTPPSHIVRRAVEREMERLGLSPHAPDDASADEV